MRADVRAVDGVPFVVDFNVQRLECGAEVASLGPAAQAAVDGLPGAVALGQITPRHPRANLPEHRIEELPVTDLWRPSHAALQQRLENLPLFVAELVSTHRQRRSNLDRPRKSPVAKVVDVDVNVDGCPRRLDFEDTA